MRVHVHVVRPDAEGRRAPDGHALQRVASLGGRGDPDEVRVRHVALAPVPLPGEANAGRRGGRVADGLLPIDRARVRRDRRAAVSERAVGVPQLASEVGVHVLLLGVQLVHHRQIVAQLAGCPLPVHALQHARGVATAHDLAAEAGDLAKVCERQGLGQE